jgi:hypothetical protein
VNGKSCRCRERECSACSWRHFAYGCHERE